MTRKEPLTETYSSYFSVLRYNDDVPLNLRTHSIVAGRYLSSGHSHPRYLHKTASEALAGMHSGTASLLHVEDREEEITDILCGHCGRDNRNNTHTALELGHLSHKFDPLADAGPELAKKAPK